MPNNVIQKVYNGGNEYLVGGGSEGQEVVYLTQAEYDVLPASKLTDGKIYKVKTTGVVPGGSADASDVGYDNTTSGLTADNVQEAIDEINTKIAGTQTTTLDGNIVLNKISEKTGTTSSIYHDNNGYHVCNSNSVLKYTVSDYTYILIDDKYLFYSPRGEYGDIYKLDLTNYGTQHVTQHGTSESYQINGMKCTLDYLYFRTYGNIYYKILIDDFSTLESVTESEYNSAVNYANSIDGLFYAQDGNDYVATDINDTEVKRYVGVGTVTGIANGKLWRTVGDVSYAMATI